MDRMLLAVVVVRNHPVILSDLRSELPVLDPGFWVVEHLDHPRRGCWPEFELERYPVTRCWMERFVRHWLVLGDEA